MLIGHYKLDGDAQDSSGNNNHGTIHGATPTTGIIDGALLFDSQQEYVVLPDLPYSGDFPITLSIWAKANSTTQADWSGIIGLKSGQTTNTTLTISYHPAYGGLHLHTWSNSINTPYSLDTNWHHYVAINTGNSEQKFYVDGIYIGSMYETLDIPTGRATLGIREYILARGDIWERTWNGAIDDVRIYDHVLSDKDISWLAEPKLITKRQEDEINKQKILHYGFDTEPEPMENFVPTGERTCDQPFTRQGYHKQAYSYYQENGYTRIYINPTSGDGPYADWGFYAHKPGGSTVGDVYTISFKYKMIKNVSNTPYLQMAYQNGYKDPTHDHAATLEDGVHIPLKDGWVQYSRTATITDAGNTWWRFGQRSNDIETEFYVDDFQVELGNSMTVFTDGAREGLAIDYTGNRHNAVLYPSTAPLWVSNSITGKGAYEFNGVDNSIDIPATTLSQQKSTLVCWIYIQDFTTNKDVPGRILCRGNNEYRRMIAFYEGGYAFETNTNSDPYELASRTSGAALSSDITAGSWFHFALVFENNTAYGYINGSLVDTVAIVDDMTIDSFGKNSDIVSYPDRFKGALDDIRIYSQALSATEIQEIYDLSTKLSIDSNQNSWTKSASSGSTTKLYKTGHLEYGPKFNKNIIEGL